MKLFWDAIEWKYTSYFSEDDVDDLIKGRIKNWDLMSLRTAHNYALHIHEEIDSDWLRSAADLFFGAGEFSDDGWFSHLQWIILLGKKDSQLAAVRPDEFYLQFLESKDYPVTYNTESIFTFAGQAYDLFYIDLDDEEFRELPREFPPQSKLLDGSENRLLIERLESDGLGHVQRWKKAKKARGTKGDATH